MSLASNTPELIIVDDSDSSDNEGQERKGHGLRNIPQHQPKQQEGKSQDTPKFLQELFGIVQWVNTGVKRDDSFEKTFMEKKVAEMETKLTENEEKLKHACLQIVGLEQSKAGLEKELEQERSEKLELNNKWSQMKDTFETLQAQYFQDAPASTDASGIHSQSQSSIIVQLKDASTALSPPPLSTLPVNVLPIPTDICETSFSGAALTNQDIMNTSQAARSPQHVQLGQETSIQVQSPVASTFNTAEQQSANHLPNTTENKLHGFDNSKAHLGFFCVCGMQFSVKRTLDSHIIYFTCEKRFACTICQKLFVGSNYLKGHMLRTHKVEYTGGSNGCRDCGKTFNTLLSLRQHKKMAHYPTIKVDLNANKKTPSKSAKTRRSIRMRHRKGESHNAVTMLQGDCNNCKFCQDPGKCKPKIRQAVKTNTDTVIDNEIILVPGLPSTVESESAMMIPHGTRASSRSSSISSCNSISFSCEYCDKWFGDDKCGLIKHKQLCPK